MEKFLDAVTGEQKRVDYHEALKDHILYDDSHPAVYVGTYAKYNEGSIFGAWLDLTTFDSYDEFIEACRILHFDESDPEFMIQDYENYPRRWYSESGMDRETFDKIKEFGELGEDEREAYEAYIEYFGDGTVEEFRERYEGHWDTDEEFADYIISSLYDLDKTMGDLARFFDYEAYARELFMTDYVWQDGYVFRNF